MGSFVLDTGVVIALLDSTDAHHSQSVGAVQKLWATRSELKISVVTLAELRSGVRGARATRLAEIDSFVTALGEDSVVPVDVDIAARAGDLRSSRRSLGLADAIVASTATAIKSAGLLTTDKALARLGGAQYVGVR